MLNHYDSLKLNNIEKKIKKNYYYHYTIRIEIPKIKFIYFQNSSAQFFSYP